MPKFTVTNEHISLLQASYAGWNDTEYGAPSIDPKYPYGDSWFYGSMARAMGLELPRDEAGEVLDHSELPAKVTKRLDRVHSDMRIVLQILLDNCTQGLQPGVYQCPRWKDKGWQLVGVETRPT